MHDYLEQNYLLINQLEVNIWELVTALIRKKLWGKGQSTKEAMCNGDTYFRSHMFLFFVV